MAGYSGKPLVAKLGIKAGTRIAILNAPAGYNRVLGKLPPRVTRRPTAAGPFDFIQFFTDLKRELERRFPTLERALTPAGMLWISWPKQSSGRATDLTENVIREIGLAHGLVDVKVAAVDEVWSGLKFVRRVQDRSHNGARERSRVPLGSGGWFPRQGTPPGQLRGMPPGLPARARESHSWLGSTL